MSKIDDLTRLKHIRDAGKEALSFVNNRTRQDLDRDRMLSLALVRLIEIIGEAAKFYKKEMRCFNNAIASDKTLSIKVRSRF